MTGILAEPHSAPIQMIGFLSGLNILLIAQQVHLDNVHQCVYKLFLCVESSAMHHAPERSTFLDFLKWLEALIDFHLLKNIKSKL